MNDVTGGAGVAEEKPVDLGTLTAAAFQPLIGEAFLIAYADYRDELRLQSVTVGRPSPLSGGRQAFTLLFRGGDSERMLTQRIHPLFHARLGRVEIFLVPMGRNPDGSFEYQACFN